MSDYYATLGVEKTATQDEIKKAYRKKALKFHPDKNPGDAAAEAHFKEVSEAYDILGDEKKRQMYDQYGADAVRGGMGGGPGAHGFASMDEALRTFMNAFGGGGGGGGESIFDSFFGGGGGGGGTYATQGTSKKMNLTISFDEAAKGVTKEVNVTRYTQCTKCSGSGAESPKDISNCGTCGGSGQVHHSRGFFSMTSACPNCHGAGKIVTKPCGECQGSGRKKLKERVKLPIPAGVDDGMRLKMSGLGDDGENGGPPGDLYVFISVKEHDIFMRDGDDVVITLPLSFADAALGVKKEIPTPLSGTYRITIPEGTQSGKILRVKGQGMPNVHGHGKGDLLVQVKVETPVNLNAKQKQILTDFAETEEPKNSPNKKSFFEKIKSFF
ncbi:MAG: molecular chaperone DnaJ [Simkaniaceae bacterium]|nr:molecular chaperone DnaJ [Simkaniaceae bacterium]